MGKRFRRVFRFISLAMILAMMCGAVNVAGFAAAGDESGETGLQVDEAKNVDVNTGGDDDGDEILPGGGDGNGAGESSEDGNGEAEGDEALIGDDGGSVGGEEAEDETVGGEDGALPEDGGVVENDEAGVTAEDTDASPAEAETVDFYGEDDEIYVAPLMFAPTRAGGPTQIALDAIVDVINRPSYAGDVLRLGISQSFLDSQLHRLYNEWKNKYLRSIVADGKEQVYVWTGADTGDENEITTAQAHGYGMITVAMMAKYDPEAQRLFTDMMRFFDAHRSDQEWFYMAGHMIKDADGDIVDAGDVTAPTEAYMDICYSFILAERMWRTSTDPDWPYFHDGWVSMVWEMVYEWDGEVVSDTGRSSRLYLHADDDFTNNTRPSDMMPEHAQTFYEVCAGEDEGVDFTRLKTSFGNEITDISGTGATGLMPDMARLNGSGNNARFQQSASADEQWYGDDACKMPWRLSMDYIINNASAFKNQISKMNDWVYNEVNGDPSQISEYYSLDGKSTKNGDESVTGRLAYTAPFMVSAMVPSSSISTTDQSEWLTTLWSYNLIAPTATTDYYDNSIRLLCSIVATRNWWAPTRVCRVTFETFGGSYVPYQFVNLNSAPYKPEDPVKEGYTFGGWYRGLTKETLYNFDKGLKQYTTLYAKWYKDGAETLSYHDPAIPFPNHTLYGAKDIIKSEKFTQEQQEEAIKAMYDLYKDSIKENSYDVNQMYLENISEGQGYGMVMLAYMAGYEPNTLINYNKMANYWLAHPSVHGTPIMGWQQTNFNFVPYKDGSANGAWVDTGDGDCATDGDFDIAYSLLLAETQWGNDSDNLMTYKELALWYINEMMEKLVTKDKGVRNDWILRCSDNDTGEDIPYASRPSDYMLQHVQEFYEATGDEGWLKIKETMKNAVRDIVTYETPETGLVPNWIWWGINHDGVTGDRFFPDHYHVGYDACRVPWRLGMDYLFNGETGLLPEHTIYNNWIKKATNGVANSIRGVDDIATGAWNRDNDIASFKGPAMVLAAIPTEGNTAEWLDKLWCRVVYKNDTGTGSVEEASYFPGAIRIFCALSIAGDWWSPTRYLSVDTDLSAAAGPTYVIPYTAQGSQESKTAWVQSKAGELAGGADVSVVFEGGAYSLVAGGVSFCELDVREATPYESVPFGAHFGRYADGVNMLSSRIDQAELDGETARLYEEWKKRYLRHNKWQPDQAYVDWSPEPDWEDPGITVSEGHGYGMTILAAMAGYDPNAHKLFDDTVRFWLAHRVSGNGTWTMFWRPDYNNTGTSRGNSMATDGDLDIAYALLMADKQWGGEDTFEVSGVSYTYKDLAVNVLNDLMTYTVNKNEWILYIANASATSVNTQRLTRPSDFMLQHFNEFAAATGDERWITVKEAIYDCVNELVEKLSPNTGLLPDKAYKDANTGWSNREASNVHQYGYDACRVPWRLSMEYLFDGETGVFDQLTTLNKWMQDTAQGDPHAIKCGIMLDGSEFTAFWTDPAFTGPIMVSAMVPTQASNMDWLETLWNYNVALDTDDEDAEYFDNSIRLLCSIIASGNWWGPSQFVVDAGAKESSYVPVVPLNIQGFEPFPVVDGGTKLDPEFDDDYDFRDFVNENLRRIPIIDDGYKIMVRTYPRLASGAIRNNFNNHVPGTYSVTTNLRDLPDEYWYPFDEGSAALYRTTTVYVKISDAYAVTFDSNGGSEVEPVNVIEGDLVPEPDAPAKAGYDFNGWYKDEGLAEPWDFDEDVPTSDITLYACWDPRAYISIESAGKSRQIEQAEFILSLAGRDVLTLEVVFELDCGDILTFSHLATQYGFAAMDGGGGEVTFTDLGDGVYEGRATFVRANSAAGSNGFSSEELVGIVSFFYDANDFGEAVMKLKEVKAYGLEFEGGEVVELGTGKVKTEATAHIFSKYDLNCDGVVNAADLSIVAMYCQFMKDDPEWDTLVKVVADDGKPIYAWMCDFNGDGIVDMLDLIELFLNYSE